MSDTRRDPAGRKPHGRDWSFRIATLAGIELRVHVSFFLIVALFALGSRGPGGPGVLSGLAWLVIIFTCITLHEMAHSLVARRRGIGVEAITLLPIGGVSRLERMPDDPRDELAIAIVGPLTSIAIAVVFAVAASIAGEKLLPVDVYSGALLPRIAWFNLIVAGFNLLPAFPMDGGRVLRAALERRTDRVTATAAAANVGRAFAAAMIVAGFFWNFWLAFVGVFIFLGASSEQAAALTHARLRGLLVRDVMLLDPVVLDAGHAADEVVELLRRTAQNEFPVVREGVYSGIVDAENLEAAPAGVPVGELADGGAPSLGPGDPLDRAFDALVASGRRALAVLSAGSVVGLLGMDDVRRVLARGGTQAPGSARPAA